MMDGGFHLKSAPKLSNHWGPPLPLKKPKKKKIIKDTRSVKNRKTKKYKKK